MHDQKKIRQQDIDAKTRELELQKIERFKELYAECMQLRKDKTMTREALERLNTLLEINPELYTMYNYRRKLLVTLWTPDAAKVTDNIGKSAKWEQALSAERDEAVAMELLVKELEFSTKLVQKDFKCYAAWLHRRWLLRNLPINTRIQVLVKENKKCEAMLKLDERNFHVWGYRRWVTNQLAGTPHYNDETELAYTESKIGNNFSNYSAWHNRALVFSSMVAAASENKNEEGASSDDLSAALLTLYEKEAELVIKAMYCDPEDQSAWLYARTQVYDGLRKVAQQLESAGSSRAKQAQELYESVVKAAIEACSELIETEEDAPLKWPRWLLVNLIDNHGEAVGKIDGGATNERLKPLVEELCKIDVQRSGYFQDLLARHQS